MDQDTKDPSAPLDEVMLAMDVVDTLRHRQQLVERELKSADREQALMKRLKEIYAEQGIDVPDKILAEGVAALREDRFTYEAPEPGVMVKLARMYVSRGRWSRGVGLVALIGSILGISYHYSIRVPEAQKLEQRVTSLNSRLDTFAVDLATERARAERIRTELNEAGKSVPAELASAVGARTRQAEGALERSQNIIDRAQQLPPATRLDAGGDDFEAQETRINTELAKRDTLLNELRGALSEAEQATQEIDELKVATAELPSTRDAIAAIAREDAAVSAINAHYASGMAALRLGDLPGVRSRLDAMRAMRTQLDQAYRLVVVARAGERSGVWRIPDANPSARNYYLIVEAVSSGGERLRVPVTNEETGRLERVTQWGLRVNKSDFDRVAADKQDDGIIQNNEVGTKQRGFLEPDYKLRTTGAAITSW